MIEKLQGAGSIRNGSGIEGSGQSLRQVAVPWTTDARRDAAVVMLPVVMVMVMMVLVIPAEATH